jgi:hypothetical protein
MAPNASSHWGFSPHHGVLHDEFIGPTFAEERASFRRGCEIGLPAACGMVGYVARDVSISDRGLRLDAETFYRVYCTEGGNRRCRDRIEKELENHGEAIAERVVHLLRRDCDDDSPHACYLWGLFADAESVPAGRFEAAFRKGCRAGIAGACRHLAHRLRGAERPVDAEEAEARACELDRAYCD